MSYLNSLSIKARMILSFAVIGCLMVMYGVVSINQMNVLSGLTRTLYNHPLKVSNAACQAKSGVISMHRHMKDVSTSQTPSAVTLAIQKVQLEERRVFEELEIVRENILGEEGKQLAEKIIDMFAGWKPIRMEVEELVLQGDRAAANRITREKGADYVARLERQMSSLTSYAINKADGFMSDAQAVEQDIVKNALIFILVLVLAALGTGWFTALSILTSVDSLKGVMTQITESGQLKKARMDGRNEITEMAFHFNELVDRLKDQFWLSQGMNELNNELSGELSYDQIVTKSIQKISRYIDACAGALYALDETTRLCTLVASYAMVERTHLANQFKIGEGIIGQVALEKVPILLKNIKREEAVGESGIVSEPPMNLYAVPLFYENKIFGVIEIAAFEKISPVKQEYVTSSAAALSIMLHTAYQNDRIKGLLENYQKTNEKLKAQTEELQAQTEELQALNEEFQQQANEMKEQNIELDAQRRQVEEANRLKSEFLSNMSHELRTPLNSVNALSRVLILQAGSKLSVEEREYLEIIERNGKQLLSLINDILDLSKIESGRMDIQLTRFPMSNVIDTIVESLEPIASEKNIYLETTLSKDLGIIESDESRVFQILQNVIANAVKFTDQGGVSVSAEKHRHQVEIKVADTGIGIDKEQIKTIFEEFRQIDGTAARKFEGTGLGLAIAYKAARMLSGDIKVESTLGQGTVFTIILPVYHIGSKKPVELSESLIQSNIMSVENKELKTILVVDDDPDILEMISNAFKKEGFNVVTARSGKEAVYLAGQLKPYAITLDVIMPEMDGWEVLSQLKRNPETAAIPVIIVSVSNDQDTGFALGAVGYVSKPIDHGSLVKEINKIYGYLPSKVMVVDDNEMERLEAVRIVSSEGMTAIPAASGKQCIELLENDLPDVLILDLVMPELNGFEVMERIRSNPATSNLPIIVVTAKHLTQEEKENLMINATSVLQKSSTSSKILIQKIKKVLSKIGKKVWRNAHHSLDNDILLVEDNEAVMIQLRKTLEMAGISIDVTRDGQQAIEYLKNKLPKGIILDLMMPNVDGFEVLETIRKDSRSKDIPVLVLTAKDLTREDMAKLQAYQVLTYIQKGDVDRDGLLEKVEQLIDQKSENRTENIEAILQKKSFPITREQPLILAIEDNKDNMTTLKAIIPEQYSVHEATDGEQGLNMAFDILPDLILLDVALPKIDGVKIVQKLKTNAATQKIPVLALTAHSMKGDRERLIDSGFDDYISKPIDPDFMLKKLSHWLSKKEKTES